MKKKDVITLWEKEGDLEKMRLFFEKNSPNPEQVERIKQLTLQKIQTEEDPAHRQNPSLDLEAAEWGSETLLQRIVHWLQSLWWRWHWKLALPLLAAFLLIWVGGTAFNSPFGNTQQKNTRSQAMNQVATGQAPAASSPYSTQDNARGPQDQAAAGFAVGGSPAASQSQSQSLSLSQSQIHSQSQSQTQNQSIATPDPSLKSAAPPADESLPRKITYMVNLTLQVDNVNQAMNRLNQAIKDAGGYIAESRQDDSTPQGSAHLTLKVPAGQWDEFQAKLQQLGKVLNQQTTANDITNQYYDAQTRLRSWQAQEQRYLEILKEAKTVEDILKVENALGNIRLQIEELQGQLKLWDQEVAYSTVQITLQTTPSPVSINDPWQPVSWVKTWQAAKEAFLKTVSSTWNAFNYLVVGIAYALPYLVLMIIVYGVYRIFRQRRMK